MSIGNMVHLKRRWKSTPGAARALAERITWATGLLLMLTLGASEACAQLVATVEVTPKSIVTNVCDPANFDADGLFEASGSVTCDSTDLDVDPQGPFVTRSGNSITVTYMIFGAGPYGGTAEDTDSGTVTLITGCNQGACPPGGPDSELNTINFKMGLGQDASGYTAGWLWIEAEKPSVVIATPRALKLLTGGSSLDEVRDTNGVLLQVKAPECLANVSVANEFKYNVAFYYAADVSLDENNCYTWGEALPFTVYTIENPAASPNDFDVLRISQTTDGMTNVYEYTYGGSNNWDLKTGNGLRQEFLAKTEPTTASVWSVTRTVKDESGAIVSKRRTTYQRMYRGEMLLPDTNYVRPAIRSGSTAQNVMGGGTSVVFHADVYLSRVFFARAIFARISSALAVQVKLVGLAL